MCGVRSAACGVRCAVCGVRRAACGVVLDVRESMCCDDDRSGSLRSSTLLMSACTSGTSPLSPATPDIIMRLEKENGDE